MKRSLLILGCCIAGVFSARAQYKYGLSPMQHADYVTSVRVNPEKELVDLARFIPGIILDIRYATKNNFTGEQIYGAPKAYARKPVAEALKRVQEDVSKI
jgi:D-alanyl-D-alanine dipeptidase